jgi:phage-related holin
MKSFVAIFVLSVLNFNFNILPTGTLMVGIGLAMLLDLATGVVKAVFKNQQRTSEGYRKTIKKFTQYFGAISIGILIRYAFRVELNAPEYLEYADFFNNSLLMFIIFIEIVSILENMLEIDNKSPFAKYFIRPILSVLTIALKKNEKNLD